MTDERKKKFIWGAKAIGKAAGLDTRQAYHLLQLGTIPASHSPTPRRASRFSRH